MLEPEGLGLDQRLPSKSHSGPFYSSFFSFSSFFPSHTSIINIYQFILLKSCASVTRLPSPSCCSALSHLSFAPNTPFSLLSLSPPVSTPPLLYTEGFITKLPTTHRTKPQVLAKVLFCLSSHVSHHTSLLHPSASF